MHEWVCCHDEAANHQLPIAEAFWIIWIVSMEECSSLMQNLMNICCSTLSVILNVTATQYKCSLNGVYHPHWLAQWSRHCSCLHIPVSLAAGFHLCCANHSHYVNNGCTFFWKTSHIEKIETRGEGNKRLKQEAKVASPLKHWPNMNETASSGVWLAAEQYLLVLWIHKSRLNFNG